MDQRPTRILEKEHHLIQKVVGAMSALADRVHEGLPAEKDTLVSILDFMRIFVAKNHFAKEDNYLFPLLIEKGVSAAGCPVWALTQEHQSAVKLTDDLGVAVEVYLKYPLEMGRFLVITLRDIVALYPSHVWKENYLLFPITDKILSENEQQELAEKFRLVDRETGPDDHQRFEQMATILFEKAQEA